MSCAGYLSTQSRMNSDSNVRTINQLKAQLVVPRMCMRSINSWPKERYTKCVAYPSPKSPMCSPRGGGGTTTVPNVTARQLSVKTWEGGRLGGGGVQPGVGVGGVKPGVGGRGSCWGLVGGSCRGSGGGLAGGQGGVQPGVRGGSLGLGLRPGLGLALGLG